MTTPWHQHPIFAGVAPAVVESLAEAGKVRRYPPGDFLLREGERDLSFFVLRRGSVRVFYTSLEGLEVVVKIFAAPAVFGEMECLADIAYLESVQAVEAAEVLVVPRPRFLAALGESHTLTTNLLRDLAMRLCIAAHNERALAFDQVDVRLGQLFCTYLDLYGVPVPEGTKIRIPLSQDDLANALGVARRSVTRTLKRWSNDRLVSKHGRHFVVHDRERLRALLDPEMLQLSIGYAIGERGGSRR